MEHICTAKVALIVSKTGQVSTRRFNEAPFKRAGSARPKKLACTIGLSIAATAVTGCATLPSGVSQSAIATTQTQQLAINAPIGSPLVVVRYPAFVEDSAEQTYYDAFRDAAIGRAIDADEVTTISSNALADSIVLKSNYFALSVYKELAARLPEHSVLLSPHSIDLGADGRLTSTPMTQAESLPNILTVDFASYTFPDSSKMIGNDPLTFGNIVTPLVVVRTNHQAAPATQGVLLASAPLLKGAADNSRESLENTLEIMRRGRLEPDNPDLDFVSYLNGHHTINVASHSMSSNEENSIQSLPVERIVLDEAIISKFNYIDDASVDPFKTAYSQAFANRVIGLLNEVDVDKAVIAGRASAISEFDESLATLTYIGSDDPTYQARFRYAERMLDAEQKYLSVQSLRLFDGIHNSEMGGQIRDMLKAEHDVILERQDILKRQRASTALAVLSGVAAVGIIATSGSACGDSGGCNSALRSIASDILLKGAVYAGANAFTLNKLSKSITDNYLDAIVPALEQQTSIQVSLIDSNETITAIRHEDLQAKLNEIYNDNTRALQEIGTRCAYGTNGNPISGVWLGMCTAGLANGSGAAVLTNANGEDVEYYGYASNGLANGPGLMVVHKATQSEALEGNFSAGFPNGVIKQSISGRADRLVVYQMGQIQGAAPHGSHAASPFNSQAPIAQLSPQSQAYNISANTRPIAPIIAPVAAPITAPVIRPANIAPLAPHNRSSSALPLAPTAPVLAAPSPHPIAPTVLPLSPHVLPIAPVAVTPNPLPIAPIVP